MKTSLPTVLVLVAAIGFTKDAYGALCSKGDLNRVVSIVYSEPGQATPCEVLYEKPSEGESMTLWRADNQTGYCEARAAEFIEKLSELGWSCSAQEEARPTGSSKAEG